MTELGQLLKAARLEQNLTLDDVQEITKIRKRYLEAIEAGDYSVLPGNFYTRAFIKNFAEAVGLDPDAVFEHYQGTIPSATEESHIEPVRVKRKFSRRSEKWSKGTSLILMCSFIILIVGIIYFYYVRNHEPNGNMLNQPPITQKGAGDYDIPPEPNSSDPNGLGKEDDFTPQDLPDEVDDIDDGDTPAVQYIKTEGTVSFYEIESEEIEVEISIEKGTSWVGIYEDSTMKKSFVDTNLSDGSTETWTFDSSVFVVVGFAAAVQLTVNDHEMNTSDRSGPERFQLDLIE